MKLKKKDSENQDENTNAIGLEVTGKKEGVTTLTYNIFNKKTIVASRIYTLKVNKYLNVSLEKKESSIRYRLILPSSQTSKCSISNDKIVRLETRIVDAPIINPNPDDEITYETTVIAEGMGIINIPCKITNEDGTLVKTLNYKFEVNKDYDILYQVTEIY